ncbi:hypothetical protein NLX86_25825 [Streptomyces sp. A3M-1-3]|uniref:hypothetical protein n=1 Tax=Streptomyces sp. A3M-1-3 TaxID=2962044 RepID=UPI0020B6D843|nr:hypothetical protein [Streptomyces sp. A3M-1-3]MCP3821389.1 hypothetical protein [Streptomyces sp. A3M-1-3]
MGNRADEYGTDVEIYRKALTTTIHADTPTGAPEQLLDLLDRLGLDRQEIRTAGPVYMWHVVPEHLDAHDQKRLASRAIPTLLMAGYKVNCTPEVFDRGAYEQAAHEIRSGKPRPATQNPAPAAAPERPAPSPHTP